MSLMPCSCPKGICTHPGSSMCSKISMDGEIIKHDPFLNPLVYEAYLRKNFDKLNQTSVSNTDTNKYKQSDFKF